MTTIVRPLDARVPRHRVARRPPAALVLAPVAWGVLMFGAVYPWAYWPLLVAVAAVGAYGWLTAARDDTAPARGVAAALACVAAVAVVQLVPLPAGLLARISPATDGVLAQYDVAYALARDAGEPAWHSLSIAPSATALGLGFVLALGTYLVGATALVRRLGADLVARQIAVLGLAVAVFGLVQHATFNDRLYWVWTPINVASNAFGPFVNRNHFAGWMIMAASLTAGALLSRLVTSGPRRRNVAGWAEWLSSAEASRLLLLALALAVMILSLVWTMSRSGIGAFTIAAALWNGHALGHRRRRTTGLAVAIVLVALVAAVLWRGLDEVVAWYGRTDTLAWRIQLWKDTAPIVRDFWWSGTGLNTYGVSTVLYPTTDSAWHANEAHSDYVQVASEGGLLLVLAVLGAIAALAGAVRAACAAPQPVAVYWIRCGAAMGLLAIAIQETTDFSLQMPGNAVLFVTLIAVALHRHRDVDPKGSRG